ncbi:MAG: ABC transporter substrate-binding protein [Betaproteobacteria bacterium]|nr:ABC transporter substrate-binding protein [Betaproteobacteria bacterium]
MRIVLGYSAGASSDLLTRLVAEEMRKSLGRPIVVENKPGAAGMVGNETVKAAPKDGNTILLTPVATMAIFPHSYGASLRYDPFQDFAPVAHVASFQLGLGVGTEIPARNLAEYVALVKRDPKAGFYASAAAGSIPHFLGVMFARAAGIEMVHVPYKGTAPAMQALAAGEIAAASTVVADIGALVKAGKARLLATAGPRRMAEYPDVATFREQGYDIEGEGWYAFFAPAGTPPAAIERIGAAAIHAVRETGARQRIEAMGLEPTGLPAAELAAILKADYERWGPVIRASGFKPSQ